MAFFSDLSEYRYGRVAPQRGTLNVGWLDASSPHPVGDVPQQFVERLWELTRIFVEPTRGVHYCNLCPSPPRGALAVTHRNAVRRLGTAEIRAFGKRVAYAAPNLVFHYVVAHRYRPPDEFVDAVINGPGASDKKCAARLRAMGLDWYYYD